MSAAATAVRRGGLVVYPTETVYGLAADATDAAAVERVFDLKRRDPSKPVSVAVPTVATARRYVAPTPREERFMRTFLPGPVTVVVARSDAIPDAVTGGRERVGIRVPAHDRALAFLAAVDRPVTATSANVSGRPSATHPADLDDRIREGVDGVVDDGETPGGSGSTVVDPGTGEVHRAGPVVDAVEAWLDRH